MTEAGSRAGSIGSATTGHMGVWRWTVGYYAVLAIVLLVVHQQFFEDLVGVPASRWFWKANETYVVALVIPLYWDLVATRRQGDGTIETVTPASPSPVGPVARRLIWYGLLGALLVCLEGPLVETVTGSRLPQRVLTLRDVLFGLVLVSLYFDWSRGSWRAWRNRAVAPRMASVRARLAFFAVVLLANVAIFQDPVKDLLGHRVSNALDFHAEGFAVVFFVPLYFDVILPMTRGDGLRGLAGPRDAPRRNVVMVCWLAAMAFFAWFGQGAARDVFDNSFGQWFVRSPEPPMAAIVYTIYFELFRRLDGVRSATIR